MAEDQVLKRGCCLTLVEPDDSSFTEWASWFNNVNVTVNLGNHEKYTHTAKSQREYFDKESKNGRRFALAKSHNKDLLGVLSLNPITDQNYFFSIVFPKSLHRAPFAALEATSLFLEFAFFDLGLSRISAGLRIPQLNSWSQRLYLLGFLYEGLDLGGFHKQDQVSDVMKMGITCQRFMQLCDLRGGSLWPGDQEMFALWKMSRENFLHEFGSPSSSEYFLNIVRGSIEKQIELMSNHSEKRV